MGRTTERDTLYRILWIACREALLRDGIESDEAIRARRAWCCWEVTTATRDEEAVTEDYKRLSVLELREAVRRANPHYRKQEPASEQHRKRLIYHALFCAIHFVDLDGESYTDGKTAASGEALRGVLWAFFQRREFMPSRLYVMLRQRWINRKFNHYLEEAGLRRAARKPDDFYDDSLTVVECQALISRFRKIAQNLPPAPVARVADISTN